MVKPLQRTLAKPAGLTLGASALLTSVRNLANIDTGESVSTVTRITQGRAGRSFTF